MSDAPYSEEFIDEMREKLEARRAELVNKSRLARNQQHDGGDKKGDSIDESVDEQGTSTEMALKDRERNFLNQINDALDRITDGEYGYCQTCGNPINKERLRARPMASECIECREQREQDQRRHHAKKPGMFSPTSRGN